MTDEDWDRYKSVRGRWIALSVRETYLSDYGITHEQGKKIIDYCRKATGYTLQFMIYEGNSWAYQILKDNIDTIPETWKEWVEEYQAKNGIQKRKVLTKSW